MNKTLLKFSGLLFCFGIVNVLYYNYQHIRCIQTQSSFYCDGFLMGALALQLVIPAFVLFTSSLIILIFSKWYKGNVSKISKTIIIVLAAIVFLTPYILIFYPHGQIRTYQEYQNRVEQIRIQAEKGNENQCIEYKQKMSEYREGQPMPTPPPGCN